MNEKGLVAAFACSRAPEPGSQGGEPGKRGPPRVPGPLGRVTNPSSFLYILILKYIHSYTYIYI